MKPFAPAGLSLVVAMLVCQGLSGCASQPSENSGMPTAPSPYGSPYGPPGYGGGYADPYYGAPAGGGGWQVVPYYGTPYQSREAWELERQHQERERERKLLDAERRKQERKEEIIERKRDRERQDEIGHRNPHPAAKTTREKCPPQDRNSPAQESSGKKNPC